MRPLRLLPLLPLLALLVPGAAARAGEVLVNRGQQLVKLKLEQIRCQGYGFRLVLRSGAGTRIAWTESTGKYRSNTCFLDAENTAGKGFEAQLQPGDNLEFQAYREAEETQDHSSLVLKVHTAHHIMGEDRFGRRDTGLKVTFEATPAADGKNAERISGDDPGLEASWIPAFEPAAVDGKGGLNLVDRPGGCLCTIL